MAIDTDEYDIRHNTPQKFENARVQERLTGLMEKQLGSLGPILLKKYFPDRRTTLRENAYKNLSILEDSLKPFLGDDRARAHIKTLRKNLEDYDLYHYKEPGSSIFDNSKIHNSLGILINNQMGPLGMQLLNEYFPENHTTPKTEAYKKLEYMETVLGPFLGEPLTEKYIGALKTKLLANGVHTD